MQGEGVLKMGPADAVDRSNPHGTHVRRYELLSRSCRNVPRCPSLRLSFAFTPKRRRAAPGKTALYRTPGPCIPCPAEGPADIRPDCAFVCLYPRWLDVNAARRIKNHLRVEGRHSTA